jgi:polar amino acid transport system substrate-binding protein
MTGPTATACTHAQLASGAGAGRAADGSRDSRAAPARRGPRTTARRGPARLLPDDLRASGTLRFGTDASYAPASTFAQDGRTIVGFEPDLLAAVSRVLGISAELVPLPFDGLLDDVTAGRIDVAMSAMTDTPARQASADFVNYFTAGTSIVVRRGNPHGVLELGDLCGSTVAVERATVQVDLVARAQSRCGDEPVELHELPDNVEALLELRTGRAVAVLSDYPPAAELANGVRTAGHFQLALGHASTSRAVRRRRRQGPPRLRDALHGAFERLMASGEYDRILREWQVERGAVRRPSINAPRAGRRLSAPGAVQHARDGLARRHLPGEHRSGAGLQERADPVAVGHLRRDERLPGSSCGRRAPPARRHHREGVLDHAAGRAAPRPRCRRRRRRCRPGRRRASRGPAAQR